MLRRSSGPASPRLAQVECSTTAWPLLLGLGCFLATLGCAEQPSRPAATVPPIEVSEPASEPELDTATPGDAVPVAPVAETEPATGLQREDLVVGTGDEAKSGDTVVVHYVGTLLSTGEVFDSSRERGTPFKITLGKNHVIQGWEQGLPGMRVGGTRRLTIPPELAYGDRGRPPKIPPSSTLVFEIELLSIE